MVKKYIYISGCPPEFFRVVHRGNILPGAPWVCGNLSGPGGPPHYGSPQRLISSKKTTLVPPGIVRFVRVRSVKKL